MSNHLSNCGLKIFEHENSPPDDVLRGARSYEEVLAWIQSLAPKDTTSVLRFQEKRRSCLPAVLGGGGLGVSEMKQKDVEGSEDVIPNLGKHQEGEQMRNSEAEVKTPDPPRKQNPETEIKTPGLPKK